MRVHVANNTIDAENLPAWLIRRLSTVHTTVRRSDDGYVVVKNHEPLIGAGVARANAGLLDVLRYVAALRSDTLDVTYEVSPHRLPPPQPRCAPASGISSEHVPLAIGRNTQTLIRYDRERVDLAASVVEIANAFRDARIAVIIHSRSRRRDLLPRLRQLGLKCRLAAGHVSPPWDQRVVICSARGALDRAVELNHRHLVVFPYAEEAIGVEMQDVLREPAPRFHLAGLLPYQQELSPRAQDFLRCAFGFSDVRLPMPGFREVVVSAVLLNFRCPAVDAGNDVLSILRRGVWRHEQRNLFISRLARALVAGDGGRIARSFPDIRPHVENLCGRRVAVVAANLEQAGNLLRFLPGWSLSIDDNVDLEQFGTANRRRLMAGASRWNCGNRLIATLSSLDRVNPGILDIVIWAGGGRSRPELPLRHLICPCTAERRMTLIDLVDHHHPTLALWSRKRMQAYRHAEWLLPDENHIEHRITQWLRRRSEVTTSMEARL